MGVPEVILLLDTHVVAWLAEDEGKFSKKAVQAIERAKRSGGGLAISSVTLFELAQQVVRKRIQMDVSLDLFLRDVETRFSVLQLSAAIAERAVRLPESFPNDPMDRIIAATALVEGIPLVTADERIRESGVVETIW